MKLGGNQAGCPNSQARVFLWHQRRIDILALHCTYLAADWMQVYKVGFDLLPQSICIDAYFTHGFWVID